VEVVAVAVVAIAKVVVVVAAIVVAGEKCEARTMQSTLAHR
jgi:hypothetical protein